MFGKPMLSFKIVNKSSKQLIKNRKFSTSIKEENWCCNSFFPAKANSQILKSDAIVITNTILPKHFTRFWDSTRNHICADGGANRLYDFFTASPDAEALRQRYKPQSIIGDLDSLNKQISEYYEKLGAKIIRLSDQDSTDLEKCLNYIPDSKSILILGGLGGNFTQTLGNINTLYLYPNKKISLLSDENVTFLLQPGVHNIECKVGTKVGLIPIGHKCSSVTTSGLKWDIENQELMFGGLVSTSNEIVNSVVKVTTSHPLLWLVDFR